MSYVSEKTNSSNVTNEFDSEFKFNSYCKSIINKTNLYVSGISFDNYIEAIEDNNKRFFLGIQWHPENMYDSDIDAKKIFDYFIKICS